VNDETRNAALLIAAAIFAARALTGDLIHAACFKKNERNRVASGHPIPMCLNVPMLNHEEAHTRR